MFWYYAAHVLVALGCILGLYFIANFGKVIEWCDRQRRRGG